MTALSADIVLIVHWLWIVFLILGFVFALMGSRIAYLHLGGLAFALLLNVVGWYCPLTYVENYLRSLHNMHAIYPPTFIARIVEKVVYPDVSEGFLRAGEIVLTVLYLLVYGYWAKKTGVWSRIRKLSGAPKFLRWNALFFT
jgi:hypothetical protein